MTRLKLAVTLTVLLTMIPTLATATNDPTTEIDAFNQN